MIAGVDIGEGLWGQYAEDYNEHFCLSIVIMITDINHFFYPTRAWVTGISVGGTPDRDTLIEQSPNYSNRTFSRYIIVGSAMEFIHICLHVSLHTMKCIGLFKGLY